MSDFTPHPIDDGRVTIDGKTYMRDRKGGLQPVETIKAQHLLEDEMVRKIMGYGMALSDQIARFLEHTATDVGAHNDLLAQEYGIEPGGCRGADWKGNQTFTTIDGLFKVQVQIAEHVKFGSELQTAKRLVDECLTEWSEDARPEIRSLIQRAFNTDNGQISRTRIYDLLRLDIEDARWQDAMRAVKDAMWVDGSKSYTRLYRRANPQAAWKAVPLDAAKLGAE